MKPRKGTVITTRRISSNLIPAGFPRLKRRLHAFTVSAPSTGLMRVRRLRVTHLHGWIPLAMN
jgi:hypothetical protein